MLYLLLRNMFLWHTSFCFASSVIGYVCM
jgi:hypothetical protein